MQHLLAHLCKRFMRRGTLTLVTADEKSYTCGDGPRSGIKVRFLSRAAERRVFARPRASLGRGLYERRPDRGKRHDCRRVVSADGSTRDFAALVQISTLVSVSAPHIIQIE